MCVTQNKECVTCTFLKIQTDFRCDSQRLHLTVATEHSGVKEGPNVCTESQCAASVGVFELSSQPLVAKTVGILSWSRAAPVSRDCCKRPLVLGGVVWGVDARAPTGKQRNESCCSFLRPLEEMSLFSLPAKRSSSPSSVLSMTSLAGIPRCNNGIFHGSCLLGRSGPKVRPLGVIPSLQ